MNETGQIGSAGPDARNIYLSNLAHLCIPFYIPSCSLVSHFLQLTSETCGS